MIFFVYALALVALWRAKLLRPSEGGPASLEQSNIQSLKGLCILLVMASHFFIQCKLPFRTQFNEPYVTFRKYAGQLIVVPFLFYSGYGVMASFLAKGGAYARSFPLRRILKTCLMFWIVVPFYLTERYLTTGTMPDASYSIQFFLAWNTYWYIFAIVVLYAISYAAMAAFGCSRAAPGADKGNAVVLVTFLGTVAYMGLIAIFKRYWYWDSALCYVAGMAVAANRQKFLDFATGTAGRWAVLLSIALVTFGVMHFRQDEYVLCRIGASVAFMAALFLLTVVLQIKNPLLDWCGRNLVSLYLCHNLILNAWAHYYATNPGEPQTWWQSYPVAFASILIGTALVLTPLHKALGRVATNWIDKPR